MPPPTDRLLVGRLRPEVAERVRVPAAKPVAGKGKFVLYWLRTAVRGHENPALDAAIEAAALLGKPVLVYHGLDEDHPYASDRLHTFILQGAIDLAAELERRGVPYVLHVQRPGHRGAHLKTLAAAAALVVTEDMPVPPLRRWTAAVAHAAAGPVWCVDTACVVPMRLVPGRQTRAFAFRKRAQKLFEQRVGRDWTDAAYEGPGLSEWSPQLPFEPVEVSSLAGDGLPDLVARCGIDHSVPPVPHTAGGSGAGYARWSAYRDGDLKRYSKRRNDAADPTGSSRLSPYLHFGMVSPLTIAREAAGLKARKFLDELFAWRELSYHFCLHTPELEDLSAIPDWAAATLAEHADDPRPQTLSWEAAARGGSGHALWDAAQLSLLRQGELHNNLRMSWGKALVPWTPGPREALALLLDLNHRYALDGRDPNSYGGLLWCLGQFDRPFPPAKPIFGTVRGRSLAGHARRMDLQTYRAHVTRPYVRPTPRVAVVGAGVAGLACARTLRDHGIEVVVLDKGRGVGGRCATRRAGDLRFDHGAQYLTPTDPHFTRYVRSWEQDGVVARWHGRLVELEHGATRPAEAAVRYVATPGMNALPKHLAADLPEVRTRCTVTDVCHDGRWTLAAGGEGLGAFDALVLTAPAPQTAALLAGVHDRFAAVAAAVPMDPAWCVMASFPVHLGLDWDAAFVKDAGPLAYAGRQAGKPGRDRKAESWVLHAGKEWSAEHLEDDPDSVADTLLGAFFAALDLPPVRPEHLVAHRWRYRYAADRDGAAESARCRFDPATALALAGDWLCGIDVQGAFLSGVAAAGRLLGHWNARSGAAAGAAEAESLPLLAPHG